MRGTDGFEPNGLPDAAGRGVPNAVRLAHLLAAWLGGTIGGIPNRNDQFIFARGVEGIGDIELKAIITAAMLANHFAVHKDCGFKIDCAKMQQYTPADPGTRDIKGATVPKALIFV